MILLALALGAACLGFYVLKRHRRYYLDALLLKSVLEDELGLRHPVADRGAVMGVVPWQIVSNAELTAARANPQKWREETVLKRGTISWALAVAYGVVAAFDMAAVVFVVAR